VISYFLPVTVKKGEDGIWTAQWNQENILSFETHLRVSWVGYVPLHGTISEEDEEIISSLLRSMSCYPIFIDREMHKKFYNIFCKQHLWPVMHHHSELYGSVGLKGLDRHNDDNLWYVYTTINQKFGKTVVEVYHEGDLIWIHGFHLMLLPSILRRRIARAKIGFFLHTPFPSSEIWKSLWCRENLLFGVLSADQIGFHLFEYARHFLTTCRRVVGTHYEFNASGEVVINVAGRRVLITCIHVGVEIKHIEREVGRSDFLSQCRMWKEKFGDKKILSS
jgi:trehalose 6-phosphate synthase/phosphatase